MYSSVSLIELCIHQVCVWKQSSFAESLDCFARNGVTSTALWKPLVDDAGVKQAKKKSQGFRRFCNIDVPSGFARTTKKT